MIEVNLAFKQFVDVLFLLVTTITPQLGTIVYNDYRQIACLTGLIQRAHANFEMGH